MIYNHRVLRKSSLLLLLTFVFSWIHADEMPVSAKLQQVTVYRNQARELRQVSFTLPKGGTEVVLTDVTVNLIDASLQAAIKGPADLLSASVRTNFHTDQESTLKSREAQRLQDSVKSIQQRLRWIAEQKTMCTQELSFVNDNFKAGTSKEGMKPADINALADFYRARIADLRKRLFEHTLNEEKWTEKRNQFQAQLSEMGNQRKQPTKEIVLQFSSETGGTVQVQCSYLITGAGWSPVYDIRVAEVEKPVTLEYKAKIFQNSGQEWKDVKLKISTANPSANNNRPVLNPRYVDYVVYHFKATESMAMPPSRANVMLAEKEAVAGGRDDDYLWSDGAVVSSATWDVQVEFELELKQTVPANGKEHICKLQTYTMPASYRYHAVPKLDPAAFLLARVVDYGQYNLLPGAANIFFGETYVGLVELNPNVASDTLLISLGRDERIVVKRERTEMKNPRRLLGNTKKDNYTYEITLRNNKTIPIELEVLDQIPLTRRKEIEVELLDKGGAEHTETTGRMLWQVKLKPAETRKLRLSYAVKYPADKEVQEF